MKTEECKISILCCTDDKFVKPENEETPKIKLAPWQIENLARPIAGMLNVIDEYYKNPENEKKFQEWYLRKYGKPAPKGE